MEIVDFIRQSKNDLNLTKKRLASELIFARLDYFTFDFLEAQNQKLIYELINHVRDIKKIKDLNERISEQNEKLNQAEVAMINVLEDMRDYEVVIKEERDRFLAVAASIGEGLIVVDKNFKIILINRRVEELFEMSMAAALGQDMNKLMELWRNNEKIPDGERPEKQVLSDGKIMAIEIADNMYYHVLSSGKKFPVRLVVSPLKSNGVIGVVIVFYDVSDEKALDEAKTGFIATASHQLRTPLTAIRWYTEMLQGGDAGSLNDEQKKFTEQIHDSIIRLNETLNTLLYLSHLEINKIKAAPKIINLFNFTDNLLKDFAPQISKKNLNVAVDVDAQKIGELEALIDESLLTQVVSNLISNAVNYTDEKGHIRIKIARRNVERDFLYSVEDDGIGIPQGQKSRIFEKFFRAANAVEKIPDGNGLGLALAKSLVEFWKGKIWFESEEGRGAKFYFTIPAQG